MAKYQFTTKVGATYEVEAPDDMSEDEVYRQFLGQVQNYEAEADSKAKSLDDSLTSAAEAVKKPEEIGVLEDTYRGLKRTGANILNVPANITDAITSAGAWAGGKLGLGDGTYNPAPKIQTDEPSAAVGVLADIAPMFIGGGASAASRGSKAGKVIDSVIRSYSGNDEKKSTKEEAQQALTGATIPIGGGKARAAGVVANAIKQAGVQSALGGGIEGASQVVDSVESGENKIDLGKIRDTAELGALFGAGAESVGRAVAGAPSVLGKTTGRIGESIRNVLPESLGGSSSTEAAASRIANSANRDYLESVVQGGNKDAQATFRNATTDEAGNSLLTPTQVFNDSGKGGRFRAAEQRELNRADSINQAKYDRQQSGEAFERATNELADAPVGSTAESTLQRAARQASDDFKATSNKLYNESKSSAQEILDSNNIKTLKMANTKNVAKQHLADDVEVGKVNLNTETRRVLSQFEKAKIKNIDDLDKWKRTLGEKAAKAGRNGDYGSQNALRSTLDTLRREADGTIQSIDNTASSLYRDADRYFSEGIEDFGRKSVLGRIADRANPDTAPNILLRGQNAPYNTREAAEALSSRLDNPTTNRIASDLSRGIGSEARRDAFEAATRNGTFNKGVYNRSLLSTEPQARTASELSQAAQDAGGAVARDESALNRALRQAADTISTQGRPASNESGVIGSVARIAAAPSTLGASEGVRHLWNSGSIDRLLKTNQRAARYTDFLSNPENAQQVLNILNSRGARGATSDEVIDVIEAISRIAPRLATPVYAQDDGIVSQPQVDEQVQESVQQDTTPDSSEDVVDESVSEGIVGPSRPISQRNEALYAGLQRAETGNMDNPWVRTGAPDKSGAGESTAYGPVQITGSLMRDMFNRYGDEFTDKEKQYAQYFQDQATVMLAEPNDPVFGYGKAGVLGKTQEQRELYGSIARKIIDILDRESGGDFDKLVSRWRGLEDGNYISKVSDGVNEYIATQNTINTNQRTS